MRTEMTVKAVNDLDFVKCAIKATLKWCNMVRSIKGQLPLDALPQGRRSDGKSCPCGEATSVFVGREVFYNPDHKPKYNPAIQEYDQPEKHRLPPEVSIFVELFDKGFLPQFDIDALKAESLPVGNINTAAGFYAGE